MVATISIIIVISALWMYMESRSFDYRKEDVSGLAAMNPVGWLFSGLLLWIVALPVYLVCRSKLRAAGEERRARLTREGRYAPKPRSVVGPSLAVSFAVGAIALFGMQVPSELGLDGIPGCEDDAVQTLARQILSERISDVALGSFGEVAAETSRDRRVCRVQVSSAALNESTWLTFSVEQHGRDQVFVQFR